MSRRGRWRRWGKWAGTVAAVVIAGVWVVSGWWWVGWAQRTGPNTAGGVAIGNGCILGSCVRSPVPLLASSGPTSDPITPAPGWAWWFRYDNWSSPNGAARSVFLYIPLWLPFVLVAIPTGLLWYRARRRFAAGACGRCGYDLAGVSGAVCPECGAPIAQKKAEEARASSA